MEHSRPLTGTIYIGTMVLALPAVFRRSSALCIYGFGVGTLLTIATDGNEGYLREILSMPPASLAIEPFGVKISPGKI